jgi:hypothetical protein
MVVGTTGLGPFFFLITVGVLIFITSFQNHLAVEGFNTCFDIFAVKGRALTQASSDAESDYEPPCRREKVPAKKVAPRKATKPQKSAVKQGAEK